MPTIYIRLLDEGTGGHRCYPTDVSDGKDCVTLDLCVGPTGEKIVEVELRGETWSKIDPGSTRSSESELT